VHAEAEGGRKKERGREVDQGLGNKTFARVAGVGGREGATEGIREAGDSKRSTAWGSTARSPSRR